MRTDAKIKFQYYPLTMMTVMLKSSLESYKNILMIKLVAIIYLI